MFYSSYPNIFQLVKVLMNIQTNIYIKMWSSNLTNKRREDVENEDFIKKFYELVSNTKYITTWVR